MKSIELKMYTEPTADEPELIGEMYAAYHGGLRADALELEFQSDEEYGPRNLSRKWLRVWLTFKNGFVSIDLSYDDAAKLRDFLAENLKESV